MDPCLQPTDSKQHRLQKLGLVGAGQREGGMGEVNTQIDGTRCSTAYTSLTRYQ
jgi:hypothetical protein